ncbi:MAG TPA: hypothetical protein RMH99_19540 [Sandaracinaceae bacterium LLY-WYZ-13_1]|nr:hypothetical protein [Sandaracinaceae bacterium LLY-WYZ-13_1]
MRSTTTRALFVVLGFAVGCGSPDAPPATSGEPTPREAPAPGGARRVPVTYVGSSGLVGCATRPTPPRLEAGVRDGLDALGRCLAESGDAAPAELSVLIEVADDGTVAWARRPPDAPSFPACVLGVSERLTFTPPGPGCRWVHRIWLRTG